MSKGSGYVGSKAPSTSAKNLAVAKDTAVKSSEWVLTSQGYQFSHGVSQKQTPSPYFPCCQSLLYQQKELMLYREGVTSRMACKKRSRSSWPYPRMRPRSRPASRAFPQYDLYFFDVKSASSPVFWQDLQNTKFDLFFNIGIFYPGCGQ